MARMCMWQEVYLIQDSQLRARAAIPGSTICAGAGWHVRGATLGQAASAHPPLL